MLLQTSQLFCQGITDRISQTSPPPLETVPEEAEAEIENGSSMERHRFFSVIQILFNCRISFKIFFHMDRKMF